MTRRIAGIACRRRQLRVAPDTIVIGHGPGFWAEIGVGITDEERSGYPRGQMPHLGVLRTLLREVKISHDIFDKITGGNALRVLKRFRP